jgi:hypothetical protein
VSVPLGCLALVVGGCLGPATNLDAAQRQVGFRIEVPRCLPERVDPNPVIAVSPTHNGSDDSGINFTFWYKDQRSAGVSSPAVALTENWEPPEGRGLFTMGKREVLGGHEVILTTPPNYPGMEWIDGRAHLNMATTLTWDEALKVYRSLVEPSYQCN